MENRQLWCSECQHPITFHPEDGSFVCGCNALHDELGVVEEDEIPVGWNITAEEIKQLWAARKD